jgi:DHA2 family methylenomycin A resistance protein-like MFS transporter
LAGTLLSAAGILPLLSISADWPWLAYLAALIPIGAGAGLTSAALQAAAVEAARPEQAAQAAGLFSTMRYLGSIIGAAGMAALLAGANPDLTSFRILYAFLLLSACSAVLASNAIPLPGRTKVLATS